MDVPFSFAFSFRYTKLERLTFAK